MAGGDNHLSGGFSQAILTCKKCGNEKCETDYYVSDRGVCKECIKNRVRENRSANLDYYRSYDRLRYREQPQRKELARKCAANIPMAERVEKQRERRLRDGKNQYVARGAISNALRDGKIKKADHCFFCGSSDSLNAHHHDYTRPLDVFWLCSCCHGKLHVINGDLLYRNKAAAALKQGGE